jgi:hypothetical protein
MNTLLETARQRPNPVAGRREPDRLLSGLDEISDSIDIAQNI